MPPRTNPTAPAETPTFRRPVAAVAGIAAVAIAGACHHDWDALVPRTSDPATTTVTTTATGQGGAGSGGAASGGAGGATTTDHDAGAGGGAGGGTGGGAATDGGPDGGAVIGQGECPKGLVGPALVRVPVAGGAYCVDATEVTRAQYAAWLTGNPDTAAQPPYCQLNTTFAPKAFWPPDAAVDDLPVVDLDWCDAHSYCAAAGKHLCGAIGGGAPSYAAYTDPEASEWFRACAGPNGHHYPYGDAYDPAACNGADLGVSTPAPTGSLPGCEGSVTGLLDLSGNVWEWEGSCEGWSGPGDRCRVRGGSFSDGKVALDCGVDATSTRAGGGLNTGFRCCADALP